MSYITHAHPVLTPEGGLKLVRLVLVDGWTQAGTGAAPGHPGHRVQVGQAFQDPRGVRLTDRSARPKRSPMRMARRTERGIITLGSSRRWGTTVSVSPGSAAIDRVKSPGPVPDAASGASGFELPACPSADRPASYECPVRESPCTSMGRNRAESLKAAGTGHWARQGPGTRGSRCPSAAPSCIRPSMTTPGLSTRKSLPMRSSYGVRAQSVDREQ